MLTGPAPAARKALAKAGLTIDDIDLFEVNEAFAAVVMRFINEMKVDPAKVNVNGGAIAMGHPLGATGAMILGTLLDELERQGKSGVWLHFVWVAVWASQPLLNWYKEKNNERNSISKNEDNIVILTFDSPNQSANTMNADFRTALDEVVAQLQADEDIAGIIFRSAKKLSLLVVIWTN